MGGRQRFAELVRQLRVGEVGSARSPGGAQARAKTHQGSGDTDVDAARSQARSKLVGLGMSGGGFRASLYHLGTLSVLAEVDALRRIDFISTVSGGSIIGLHFFLRLRQLLQEKKDVEITREDYIEVVADVTRTFMELVSSKDSYWRSYKNPLANFYLRMDGGRRGRIEQILRIIERDLYSQFQTPEEAACTQTCSLERLRIQPPDERETYIPYRVNQRRRAKVPVLLINATCLNSGHRFVFASDAIPPPENMLPDDARYWSYTRPGGWLGEISDPNFSSVPTLPPLKYRHIDPDGKRKLTMATAAAASASVPVIFSPVSLEGLYRTRPSYRVVLVDGSVSDNTGLETLRDCGATTVILSDGGVEVAEDQRIKYRRNPVASTGRAIDILTVQAQQDRLLAAARSKRAREAPVIHISLAFDRRFSRKTVQAKLNRNILQHDKTIMIKHTDIEAAVARMAQSPASIAPRASANNGSASSAAAANQSGGGSVSKGTRRRLFAGSAAKGNLSQAQPVGGRALGAAEELNDAEAEGEDPPPQRQWSAALPPATPMPTPLPSLSRTHDAPFQSSGHWDTPSMRASSSTSSLANQEEEEAPLPDVHKRVIRLMGRVRTHLDLFSEVECSCIMVVAYLEAAIQLRAETSRRAVHDLYSGPNGGSGDSGEPELPWSAMLLLRLTSDRGHQWGFLRLVPFLASTTWDDMEAKRGQQRLRAPHWLRQLSAMLPLVELPGAGDDDDDADEREDEAAFSRTRGTAEALALDAAAPESSGANPGLEKDTTFRWLVQDLDAQLDAAATVFPRMLSLLPRWITQLVGLLIVLGVLSTLCVLIYVLVDNFWEYRERECFQDYREEVWLSPWALPPPAEGDGLSESWAGRLCAGVVRRTGADRVRRRVPVPLLCWGRELPRLPPRGRLPL